MAEMESVTSKRKDISSSQSFGYLKMVTKKMMSQFYLSEIIKEIACQFPGALLHSRNDFSIPVFNSVY